MVSCNLPIPPVSDDDPAVLPVPQTGSWWIDSGMTYSDRHNRIINSLKNNDTDIILVGDSLTHYWEPNGFVEENGFETWEALNRKYRMANLGFAGDETEHVLWRLQHGEISGDLRIKMAVLLVGTNNSGLAGHGPQSIAAGIGMIIKYIHKILPHSKITLLSLLPRGETPKDRFRINNDTVNETIKSYDGHMNVKYYCIENKFLGPDKNIRKECFTGDYLHLSAKGYKLFGDLLLDIFDRELTKSF
jgi:lysophospholipase L1-like esterase